VHIAVASYPYFNGAICRVRFPQTLGIPYRRK